MPKFTNPLDRVSVAAPCLADWNQMVGSERVRFCGQCNRHVYNLSGISKTAAEALLTSTEDRLCIRYYRRADGTILTQNCPVGLRAIKRKVTRAISTFLSAVLSFCAGVGLYSFTSRQETQNALAMGAVVADEPESITEPSPTMEPTIGQMVMGEAVIPIDGRVHRHTPVYPIRRQRVSHR